MYMVLLLILLSLLVGCGQNSNPLTNIPSLSEPVSERHQPIGLVAEPTIDSSQVSLISTLQRNDGRSTKLNGIVQDLNNSSLYINDKIIFSTEKKNKSSDPQIQFSISTHCIHSSTTHFTKETTIQYRNEISLIELLPEEIFIYGHPWWKDSHHLPPTCGIHFTATNQQKDVHWFRLPHLPIVDLENSLFLSLIKEPTLDSDPLQLDSVNQFPMLIFHPNTKLTGYQILSAVETKVDQIKLICENVNFSIPVLDTKLYHLQNIPGLTRTLFQSSYVESSEEDSLQAPYPISQACRFMSLYQNHIVGVSQLFPLVFPMTHQLEIHVDSIQENELDGRKKLLSDFFQQKPLGTYHSVAQLNIKNNSHGILQLYMPSTSFFTTAKYFYHGFAHYAYEEYAQNSSLLSTWHFSLYNHLKQHELLMGGLNAGLVKGIGFFAPMDIPSARFSFTNQTVNHGMDRTVIQNGSRVVWSDEENPSALITLQPSAVLKLPLSVSIDDGCILNYDELFTESYLKRKGPSNQWVIPTAVIFEGENPALQQVLDNQNFESARNSVIATLSPSTTRQQKDTTFSIPFGRYQSVTAIQDKTKKQNIRFYRNSCQKMKQGIADIFLKQDKESWVLSRGKQKEQVQFRHDSNYSLSDAEERHIRSALSTVRQRILEENQKSRENSREVSSAGSTGFNCLRCSAIP